MNDELTTLPGDDGVSVPRPVKPKLELTAGQKEAKDRFLQWFEKNRTKSGIHRIFGYAGTGKTTSTKSIIEELEGTYQASVGFAAYTGKAALVMQRNGMPARTIHSLIYKPIMPDKHEIAEIREELAQCNDEAQRKEIGQRLEKAEAIGFELNEESDMRRIDLLVLDECSMVNDEMLNDLLYFKKPLLVLGDPGQLPPVEGGGALIREKPDSMLTEIMRQALDNPIIQLSLMARNGVKIPMRDWGPKAKHVAAATLKKDEFLNADQIITGKNHTRHQINKRFRDIKGFTSPYPEVGDKLICLRNNMKEGLFNGLICYVEEIIEEYENSIRYKLRSEEDRIIICRVHRAHFDEYQTKGTVKNMKWWDWKGTEQFDFGYAITVHKSQGSQYNNLIFWDDKFLNWPGGYDERKKWVYTGVTRAVDTITIAS